MLSLSQQVVPTCGTKPLSQLGRLAGSARTKEEKRAELTPKSWPCSGPTRPRPPHPGTHPVHTRHRARLLLPPRGQGRFGYPQGLQSDRIPTIGRIAAVADTYDAMTTDRVYRKALPHVIACGEMERCSGTQFDPDIVRVFLGHIEDYRKLEAAAGRAIPRWPVTRPAPQGRAMAAIAYCPERESSVNGSWKCVRVDLRPSRWLTSLAMKSPTSWVLCPSFRHGQALDRRINLAVASSMVGRRRVSADATHIECLVVGIKGRYSTVEVDVPPVCHSAGHNGRRPEITSF